MSKGLGFTAWGLDGTPALHPQVMWQKGVALALHLDAHPNRPNLYLVWAYAPIFSRKTLGAICSLLFFSCSIFLFCVGSLHRSPTKNTARTSRTKWSRRKKIAKENDGERARGFFWVNFLERNFGYLVLKYFPAELQWADSSTIVTFFFGLHIPSWGTYPDMEGGGPLEAGVWLWGLAEPFGGISGILGFRYTVDMISILFRTLKNNGLAQDFEHSYI